MHKRCFRCFVSQDCITKYAVDNDGLTSNVLKDTLTIETIAPVVNAIQADTVDAAIFIAQNHKYKITASSPHGKITKVYINWNNGSTPDDSNVAKTGASVVDTFTHNYAVSENGPRIIKVWAVNDMNIVSSVLSKSFTVRLGKPVVTGISLDTALVWIKSPRHYTFNATDTNGTISLYSISWNTGEAFKSYASSIRDTSFITAETRSIKAFVFDNNGIQSDTFSWSLVVHQGKPKVDSIKCKIIGNNAFVKDPDTFTVYTSDTNGTIKRIYAAWNNESSPTDSVDVSINKSGSGIISHTYDTTYWGPRTVKFWVRDNDSLMSPSSKDTAITVRLAPPVLWGDNPTKDTLWTIINSGYGISYNAHVNSYDTNGTIIRYYWSEAGSFDSTTATKTNDSLYSRLIGVNDVNKGFPVWIYARDDDQIVRGKQFVVYADSAPPAPDIVAANGDGGVKIMWSGKDTKDGNGTLYKIILKQGASPANTDILQDFKAGSTYVAGDASYNFKFAYTGGTSGLTYKYKVIAKDARGTISNSLEGSFIYP